MQIRTKIPHEYVNAEPGMKVFVDIFMIDDEDLIEYFDDLGEDVFVIETFDNESDILWLVDCEYAVDPEMVMKV